MSTYVSLGPRGPVKGLADNTNLNPGNWTVTFDPNTMNTQAPYTEVCKMVVSGSAIGSTFTIYNGDFQWDSVQQGYNNSWDPNVAMPYKPGQYIYFFFSGADTDGHQPIVTLWLRYDQDIQANANLMSGAQAVPQTQANGLCPGKM
jgi:hypothetical protein